MTMSRALFGTALSLSMGLAGCAMESASTSGINTVATANHMAAGSIQLASLENRQVVVDAPTPVVQKGTVILRRTGDESQYPAKPTVAEELRRLQENMGAMRGDTSQQLATVEERLRESQTRQEQTLASLKEQQARQEKELRTQTAEAVTTVASLAKQGMQSTETMAQSTTQQLAQLENRIQGTSADLRDTRQALAQAEARTKAYTAEQITAQRDVQSAQLAAISSQVASSQQLTALQIAELRKMSEENRALAQSETANVAAALRQYADVQIQQARANTEESIFNLAKATDQSVTKLSEQTNRRLGLIWVAAGKRAEKLAEQKANIVATSLIALQKQTEAQRVTPDQIREISERTVAASTPEFRALALQTMQESQDYIRTVARTAVQDKDPAMQAALADAARDVITKDDKVVFAIRKAVAEELHGATTDTASTRLGPDRATADGENLDPNRLRIAQLLSPGGNNPAVDAVPSDSQLAAISPAAGEAPQKGVGGQQSWSTPGTSLMRARNRADWMDIRQYKVVVHEDDQTMEQLLGKVLKHAEPFTGPWQIRWKISEENKDLMGEKFSLDAETTFEDFVSYLAQYVVNDRGVKLTFSLFDNERIMVISD